MKHIAVITKKPELSGKCSTPDGAITGNGDLAVILGNSENGIRLYIAKNDIWYGVEDKDNGGMRPLGYVDIDIPSYLYENYYVEQDLDLGEIRCSFEYENQKCSFTIVVYKTENSFSIFNSGNVQIVPQLKVFEGDTDGVKGDFEEDGIRGIFRSFNDENCEYETHVFASLKNAGENYFYCFVATNHDFDGPEKKVIEKIKTVDEKYIESLKKKHDEEWRKMWEKSSFVLSDKELELSWYSSQYFLMVCAGNKNFAPGIFGNFITVERPAWHNDYHLNYNYQAPFYAACSSNHPEFTDCYMAPLEEFYEKGRSFAKRFGCKGVIFPVGIAPKGLCTELDLNNKYCFERLFLGQKSNGIHPADIPVFRWKATRDEDYAREHAYPFVKECLAFFEDYAVFEKGRFSVCRDAAHEVPIYKDDYKPEKYKRYLNDKNNSLTLGLLRLVLDGAVDMAETLGIDEDKRKIWRNMLENLSPFATYYRFGKKVYRYTEKGQMWNDGGDVGLQHIYPCGCVGLSSSKKDLKIARNTFKMKSRYCFIDDNAVSSFFPMASRLGTDPAETLKKFRELNEKKRLPNLLYKFEGGCLEDCSIPASMLNEMALQSHQGDVRIFPCWDMKIDGEYHNLRADGAFLVSSSVKNGKFGSTEIFCEKGGRLSVILPYEGADIIHNGEKFSVNNNSFVVQTQAGDEIIINSK